MRKKKLTIELLCQEAATFAKVESTYPEPTLYGVTDGKAIDTVLDGLDLSFEVRFVHPWLEAGQLFFKSLLLIFQGLDRMLAAFFFGEDFYLVITSCYGVNQ
jgi:hypothetical protein